MADLGYRGSIEKTSTNKRDYNLKQKKNKFSTCYVMPIYPL